MVAAAFIDAHFEPRPSGDESEQCAYRAERVAIGAAVEGKKSDNDEGDEGNHKDQKETPVLLVVMEYQ